MFCFCKIKNILLVYMSYKQFFSNNNENSYNDYLKIKKGREMIKKSVSNKKYRLNNFINYETFLTLTKAYYNNLNNIAIV